MKEYKQFTFLGKRYFFTSIFDDISSYNFGGLYYVDNVLQKDTRSYWHKVAFGIYRKSNSWIN